MEAWDYVVEWERKMTGFDTYVFILCFIVFSVLTAISCVMIIYFIKTSVKMIEHGLEDEKIKIEYYKEQKIKPAEKILCKIASGLIFAVILIAFIISLCVQLSGDTVKGNIPTPQIVLSDSMQYKHEDNTYLTENSLDDQFATFDLIFTRKLPGEFELELYDIVVYEYRDQLIIHRIIGIEEPNEKHPDQRQFLLRGDSVKYSDEFPVLYEQMRAIYEGERIPFVGSFFSFMQSPAGYLCIILLVFAMVVTPIAEKKLEKIKRDRLVKIGVIRDDEDGQDQYGNGEDTDLSSDKTSEV